MYFDDIPTKYSLFKIGEGVFIAIVQFVAGRREGNFALNCEGHVIDLQCYADLQKTDQGFVNDEYFCMKIVQEIDYAEVDGR